MVDEAISATHQGGLVTIRFRSGHKLSFPTEGNPRLAGASDTALDTIELSPFGIHWPALDEDLSFEGIMRGDYGQKKG
ncbi:MAG: DUF2442 domain-containing protein [Candidatus Hydrogenedentes bacterium]|nr:DUF2442 domain-containing protein [Candidatus Hydrogenedentota bacterium]